MNKRNDTNLAEGEVTGHAHRCVGDDITVYNLDNGDRLLDAPFGCNLTHEEHKTHILPPGRYIAVISKEYDEVESRRVAD